MTNEILAKLNVLTVAKKGMCRLNVQNHNANRDAYIVNVRTIKVTNASENPQTRQEQT